MKKLLLFVVTWIIVFQGLAQVSKQQAKSIVMSSIVGDDSTTVNVFMEPLVQTASYYKLCPFDSILAPYSNYWLFFIDDMPEYGWGHDCRYVFLNIQNGKYNVVLSQKPIWGFNEYLEVVKKSFILDIPQTDFLAPTNLITISNENDGKYAVLFTGGEGSFTPTLFWNALSHSYTGLLEHGFKKENIFVLSCDGSTGNALTNPNLDLDHDGIDDILINKVCDVSNLQSIFSTLSNTMDESDLLYVYGTMHGWQDAEHTYLQLWNGERLYDTTLASMIAPINCSQLIFNLFSCYAGGIGDDIYAINNQTKKVILTCVDNKIVLRLPDFNYYTGMDSYNYFVNTAFRHWHPNYKPKKCNPWQQYRHIGHLEDTALFLKAPFNNNSVLTDIDFDSLSGNHNKIYEINEIINYAGTYDNFFNSFGLKHYDCGFFEDLLSLHGISGSVRQDQIVRGSFHIEDSLNIYSDSLTMVSGASFYLFNADLNIKPNAHLFVEDSCKIVAKCDTCRVIINGSMTLGNGVVFEAEKGSRLEIHFEPDTDIDIRNATFINCVLFMPHQNIQLNHCIFKETPIYIDHTNNNNTIANDTIIVQNCDFYSMSENLNVDAIYIEGCAYYLINECTVDTCGTGSFRNGIFIKDSGRSLGYKMVKNNTISNCSIAGIAMFNSTGCILGNKVYNNNYGVKLYNQCNIINFSGYCDAEEPEKTQYIHDNTEAEVYMSSGCIPTVFRYNAIVDDDNTPFVYHDAYLYQGSEPHHPWDLPSNLDVSLNYWGTSFDPSQHLYSTDNELTFVYLPYWQLDNCFDESDLLNRLLITADSLINERDYSQAKKIYLQLIEKFPDSFSAENALKSLLSLEHEMGGDYSSLYNYYNTNPTILSKARLSNLASYLSNKCNVMMGNYDTAIVWYEEILTNPNTDFHDSLYASIELGDLYLRLKENNLIITGKHQEYFPKSKKDHRNQSENALSLLPPKKEKTIIVKDTDPVRKLGAIVHEDDGVFLTWDFPEKVAQNEMTISWSNMVIENWCGSAMTCAWDAMQHFDTLDLRNLKGWRIKSITCATPVIDPLFNDPDGEFYVKIWKGEAEHLELVYQQLVEDPVGGALQTVILNEDIFVEEGENLWIGLYGDQPFLYPWALDHTMLIAPDNKGFLLYLYDDDSGGCVPRVWVDYYSSVGNTCISATVVSPSGENPNGENNLTGYKIYRNGILIHTIPYPFMTYFTDTHYSKEIDVEYCVTAVYGDEESEMECVTAALTAIAEETKNVMLFPNPASCTVTVTGESLCKVEIHNLLGQLVASSDCNGDSVTIDLQSLPQGVYLVTATDHHGRQHLRKLVVQ